MLPQEPLLIDSLPVDPRRLTIGGPGRDVSVEPLAMRILMVLVEQAGRVVTREELIGTVWPDGYAGEGSVSRAIWSVRQALGDDARSPRFIETVPRVGYRLIATVEWPSQHPARQAETALQSLRATNRRLRSVVAVLSVAFAATSIGWYVGTRPQPREYNQYLKVLQPDGTVDSVHVRSEAPVTLNSNLLDHKGL